VSFPTSKADLLREAISDLDVKELNEYEKKREMRWRRKQAELRVRIWSWLEGFARTLRWISAR